MMFQDHYYRPQGTRSFRTCFTRRRCSDWAMRRWRGNLRCIYIGMAIRRHTTRRRGSSQGSMPVRATSFKISGRVSSLRMIRIRLTCSSFQSLAIRCEGRYIYIWNVVQFDVSDWGRPKWFLDRLTLVISSCPYWSIYYVSNWMRFIWSKFSTLILEAASAYT